MVPALLSQRQEESLGAIIDALLPSLDPPVGSSRSSRNENNNEHLERFWRTRLAENASYRDAVRIAITEKMAPHDRYWLLALLTALSTVAGTVLLFATVTATAFSDHHHDTANRIRLLQRLQHSRWRAKRNAFHGLRRFLCGLAFSYTDPASGNSNPFWEAMGYPGPPSAWQLDVVDRPLVEQAEQRQAAVQKSVRESRAAAAAAAAAADAATGTIMECDVVVVGSGAGGCVAAYELAKAGYSVIVVEQGSYLAPHEITLQQVDAMDQQYEQHGLLQTTNGVIMVLAGRGLGGGTAINWSCCLPLPDYVRREWSEEHGLTAFADSEYDRAVQTVMEQMGATDRSKVTDNTNNQKLQEGCEALGYDWDTTGQNLRDTGDVAAGYIGLGDRYGNKNAGVQTYLEPAVKRFGAKIVDRCRVDRIITTNLSDDRGNERPRATGVQCTMMTSSSSESPLTIKARHSVILAAGALHTPCLLQKSGFRNRNIGRHLRLHPATGFLGLAEDAENVDAVYFAPMTTVCNEFARGPANDGYGVKIECPVAYPGLMATACNWNSPGTFGKHNNSFFATVF